MKKSKRLFSIMTLILTVVLTVFIFSCEKESFEPTPMEQQESMRADNPSASTLGGLKDKYSSSAIRGTSLRVPADPFYGELQAFTDGILPNYLTGATYSSSVNHYGYSSGSVSGVSIGILLPTVRTEPNEWDIYFYEKPVWTITGDPLRTIYGLSVGFSDNKSVGITMEWDASITSGLWEYKTFDLKGEINDVIDWYGDKSWSMITSITFDSQFSNFNGNGTKYIDDIYHNLVSLQTATPNISGSANDCVSQGDWAAMGYMYVTSFSTDFGKIDYDWTVPSGMTILSGQGTNSIVVGITNFGTKTLKVKVKGYGYDWSNEDTHIHTFGFC